MLNTQAEQVLRPQNARLELDSVIKSEAAMPFEGARQHPSVPGAPRELPNIVQQVESAQEFCE